MATKSQVGDEWRMHRSFFHDGPKPNVENDNNNKQQQFFVHFCFFAQPASKGHRKVSTDEEQERGKTNAHK